mgnify:CR=1 FL=1
MTTRFGTSWWTDYCQYQSNNKFVLEQGSNSLKYVALPILNTRKCVQAYGRFVKVDLSMQFCAGNVRGDYIQKMFDFWSLWFEFSQLYFLMVCSLKNYCLRHLLFENVKRQSHFFSWNFQLHTFKLFKTFHGYNHL